VIDHRKQIRQARSREERAQTRLDAAHDELRAATIAGVRKGRLGKTEAAELAGVTRQAVHNWLRE
jgi:hypothetical protein